MKNVSRQCYTHLLLLSCCDDVFMIAMIISVLLTIACNVKKRENM
jgi:hypothetical protein